MPSDGRVESAVQALAPAIERYRSTVSATLEEIRRFLTRSTAVGDDRERAIGAELGPFAAGRIDVESFSRLLAASDKIDPATVDTVRDACQLVERTMGDDRMFLVTVDPGEGLGAALARAFERAGRLLAAARVVTYVKRAGRAPRGNGLLGPLSFGYWKAAERRLAPPLVVSVDGADLHAGELTRFLDDGVCIVLIVRGDCPPAPLARLITPGTLVLQTSDPEELARIGDAPGPAVGALVPETAARFVHDPEVGPNPWDRITLTAVPEDESTLRTIGGVSVRQQREDLRHLIDLARTPSTSGEPSAAAEAAGPAASDPADRLAAWLLSQVDLDDPG